MKTPLTTHRNLVTLAQMLRKLEHSRVAVDPEQYRLLVNQIQGELRDHPRDSSLEMLLAAMPELAEVYENLQYEHAGLCRSPLPAAIAAEQAASQAIALARRKPATH